MPEPERDVTTESVRVMRTVVRSQQMVPGELLEDEPELQKQYLAALQKEKERPKGRAVRRRN